VSQKQVKETTQHRDALVTPADDLGELWQTLDVLPEAEPPEDFLATTIAMIAVDAGHRRTGKTSRFARVGGDLWQWFAPAIAVGVSIVIGFFIGQATLGTPQPQQEPVDWRARRQEILKNTLQEAIENDPAAAKKFIEKQLRDARDAEGRPLAPQQNNTAVPRSGGMNPSKPRNARPYSSGDQGKKERLRGKQLEPLRGADDQPQKQ
jgi:hypothetical protein